MGFHYLLWNQCIILVKILDIYLKNAVGIGEHPQHFEEMDKLVDQMATAKDKLMTLNDEYGAPVEQILNESYGGTESD